MLAYIIRRLLYMIPTLIGVSFVAFAIIQLPPGDFMTTMLGYMADAQGSDLTPEFEATLRAQYGLDQPLIFQYFRWITGILFHGDFGWSFGWGRPAGAMIADCIGLTLVVSGLSLAFVWIVALPIGIYSAARRYTIGDHLFTLFGFIGLAIPNFLMALTLMVVGYKVFGLNVGGLFSPGVEKLPWGWEKFADLLAHIWVPVVVVGMDGTASLIRIMRANLSDELEKPYVVTARAKGLSERTILFRYPLRIALNPFVSTLGWLFPALISGVTITAIVLNLPTAGPILIRALVAQDMYLAGSIIFILSTLTLVGMLISDILLALLDPRIRFR